MVKTGFRTPRADRKRGGDEEEKSGTLCLIHLRFAVDSPLERDRFEPSVPPAIGTMVFA